MSVEGEDEMHMTRYQAVMIMTEILAQDHRAYLKLFGVPDIRYSIGPWKNAQTLKVEQRISGLTGAKECAHFLRRLADKLEEAEDMCRSGDGFEVPHD